VVLIKLIVIYLIMVTGVIHGENYDVRDIMREYQSLRIDHRLIPTEGPSLGNASGCQEVIRRGLGQLTCESYGEAYLLKYSSASIRTAVKLSGHHRALIDHLCQDSLFVVEAVAGEVIELTRCEKEETSE
jgi:hypothetical protein